MAQKSSRAVFDSLLTKTHVQHALIQPDGRHNEIPGALATLLFLGATPDRLEAAYASIKDDLGPWEPSPRSIADEETKERFLGDARFQRAFMSYFSMENGMFSSNPKTLALSHLFSGPQPLLAGLFSSVGRPLALLADGIELRAALLLMQSLTLCAVDFPVSFHDLLTHPPATPPPLSSLFPPEDLIGLAAYDGRLSGVMKAGPGFHGASHIFASAAARAALGEYLWRLDARDEARLLQQLAALAALLLAATHKPAHPAFDLYLARLVTCVNSVRVLLELPWVEEPAQRGLLVRGLWLVVLVVYITQLRPVIDGKLLVSRELAEEQRGWEGLWEAAGVGEEGTEERFGRGELLRALRSLSELAKRYGAVHGRLYFHAAWKLVGQWEGWTGLGIDREVMLNIRL
ncbi:hypothetical protein C8A05DRAFT_39528 [Staphylotrichum tortipilum]|uniref:Uncharacterized protein n=1 Tax=Staphylotrichum tortipilum TaxID=2831512 RepID=A0AAN6M9K2_9PEZI|nr:hypothetical protein C8A05DRAFT_39528 [Staphylotrichum longicolle]